MIQLLEFLSHSAIQLVWFMQAQAHIYFIETRAEDE